MADTVLEQLSCSISQTYMYNLQQLVETLWRAQHYAHTKTAEMWLGSRPIFRLCVLKVLRLRIVTCVAIPHVTILKRSNVVSALTLTGKRGDCVYVYILFTSWVQKLRKQITYMAENV